MLSPSIESITCDTLLALEKLCVLVHVDIWEKIQQDESKWESGFVAHAYVVFTFTHCDDLARARAFDDSRDVVTLLLSEDTAPLAASSCAANCVFIDRQYMNRGCLRGLLRRIHARFYDSFQVPDIRNALRYVRSSVLRGRVLAPLASSSAGPEYRRLTEALGGAVRVDGEHVSLSWLLTVGSNWCTSDGACKCHLPCDSQATAEGSDPGGSCHPPCDSQVTEEGGGHAASTSTRGIVRVTTVCRPPPAQMARDPVGHTATTALEFAVEDTMARGGTTTRAERAASEAMALSAAWKQTPATVTKEKNMDGTPTEAEQKMDMDGTPAEVQASMGGPTEVEHKKDGSTEVKPQQDLDGTPTEVGMDGTPADVKQKTGAGQRRKPRKPRNKEFAQKWQPRAVPLSVIPRLARLLKEVPENGWTKDTFLSAYKKTGRRTNLSYGRSFERFVDAALFLETRTTAEGERIFAGETDEIEFRDGFDLPFLMKRKGSADGKSRKKKARIEERREWTASQDSVLLEWKAHNLPWKLVRAKLRALPDTDPKDAPKCKAARCRLKVLDAKQGVAAPKRASLWSILGTPPGVRRRLEGEGERPRSLPPGPPSSVQSHPHAHARQSEPVRGHPPHYRGAGPQSFGGPSPGHCDPYNPWPARQ